ncbi:hypothetical protein CAC42_4056 [Sphaceloma murrayae]|uniref:DNA replication factor Cdt1 C-terminal domain-containing protein n=1 Tax=Sphaceloma murrayae TaxID=2082308 RepID=A0A2K1QSP5_9PEZI|nr:hypothetical protein CAC42_4056 [Sphaceloma murrayae]
MSRKRKATEETLEPIDQGASRAAKTRKMVGKSRRSKQSILPHAPERSLQQDMKAEASRATQPSTMASKRANKRQRSPEPVETPRHKRIKDTVPPTPEETPTRGASRLFDRLNLVNTEHAESMSKNLQAYQSPPETPHHHTLQHIPVQLPASLEDLKLQFSAFLSAQALFVTHHGAGAQNHLVELAARVTKTWRKRAITTNDIRKLLGILGEASPFLIVDNGDGRLCLELKDAHKDVALHTKELTDEFISRLQRRWLRWNARTDSSEVDERVFLDALPLASVMKSEVAIDSTKQSKGALRLAMMKNKPDGTSSNTATCKIDTVAQEAKTATAITSRGTSLMDRILAKQQIASTLPSAPTKADLERLAALDRVEDVARVLDFLAGARPRASFSMQSLVQHLQSSLRNPIARDEAERCVTLMAEDVCPRFIGVIKTGGLHGVVITKMGRPSQLDLRRRLDELKR